MSKHEETSFESMPARVRLLVGLAIAAAAVLFVGANAHLLYVALASQPDCIPHAKAGEVIPGTFGAAKSAC